MTEQAPDQPAPDQPAPDQPAPDQPASDQPAPGGHRRITGRRDPYTWLRLVDGPDPLDVAASRDGVIIRHGSGPDAPWLVLPTATFTGFLHAADTPAASPLAELIETARTLEAAEAARPKPAPLGAPMPPQPPPRPPTKDTYARIHELRVRIDTWLSQPPP